MLSYYFDMKICQLMAKEKEQSKGSMLIYIGKIIIRNGVKANIIKIVIINLVYLWNKNSLKLRDQ